MAGFAENLRKERERRDKALEKALDGSLRRGSSTAPSTKAAPKARGPVKHQMEEKQNAPKSITSGQAAREARQAEIRRKIKELEGK